MKFFHLWRFFVDKCFDNLLNVFLDSKGLYKWILGSKEFSMMFFCNKNIGFGENIDRFASNYKSP